MRNTWRTVRLVLAIALLGSGLVGLLAGPATGQTSGPTIVHLSLTGVVDPFEADYLRNGIDVANTSGASAVLLTIDTPGGLSSSMLDIIQSILNSKVPVICFVSPQGARAASAGAFIMMSCPVAAMAPGSEIGAATPVGVSGVVLTQKVTNDAVAKIRSLAELRGRNADLAESFVREATSVSAMTALDQHVIDLIALDVPSLLQDVSGKTFGSGETTITIPDLTGATIVDRHLTPVISFLHSLLDPDLAFIFFWLGLVLIVFELLAPGHLVSGLLGALMLIAALVSFGVLPVRLVGIVLMALSVLFFLLELKVPGLGVWSVAGIAALVLGGLTLFNGTGGARVSPIVIAAVAGFVALYFGFIVTKMMAIRSMPPLFGPDRIIGGIGVAIAGGLHPEGLVRVAAEEWRAVSTGGDVEAGTTVRVTKVEGLKLWVEPVTSEETTPAANAPAERGTGT